MVILHLHIYIQIKTYKTCTDETLLICSISFTKAKILYTLEKYLPGVRPYQVSGKGYSKRSLTGGISPLAKHLKYLTMF